MIVAAVGLLLGFAGPFGSYPAYPTVTRYAFWLGLTAAGAIAATAADALLPRSKRRDGALRIAALALISAIPMTFVVAWTMSLVQQGRVFTPQQLPALFVAVALIQLLVVFATSKAFGTTRSAAAPEDPADCVNDRQSSLSPAFPDTLLAKLPAGIGRDIIALETEDHYLRVHALGGSALVLMRMADAVSLIDVRLGERVHRRWWIADKAVVSIRTEGQKLSLCLVNQIVVPVGRTFAAQTKARFVEPRRMPTGPEVRR